MAKKTFISFGTGSYEAENPRWGKDIDLEQTIQTKTESLGLQAVDPANDFADDAAAAAGNVPVGGLYHTSGAVKIRLT